jgi:hypothetical protein
VLNNEDGHVPATVVAKKKYAPGSTTAKQRTLELLVTSRRCGCMSQRKCSAGSSTQLLSANGKQQQEQL